MKDFPGAGYERKAHMTRQRAHNDYAIARAAAFQCQG